MQASESIDTLRFKHASLEQAIEEEISRPYPNNQHISDLKRQKLRIKDELQRLANA